MVPGLDALGRHSSNAGAGGTLEPWRWEKSAAVYQSLAPTRQIMEEWWALGCSAELMQFMVREEPGLPISGWAKLAIPF